MWYEFTGQELAKLELWNAAQFAWACISCLPHLHSYCKNGSQWNEKCHSQFGLLLYSIISLCSRVGCRACRECIPSSRWSILHQEGALRCSLSGGSLTKVALHFQYSIISTIYFYHICDLVNCVRDLIYLLWLVLLFMFQLFLILIRNIYAISFIFPQVRWWSLQVHVVQAHRILGCLRCRVLWRMKFLWTLSKDCFTHQSLLQRIHYQIQESSKLFCLLLLEAGA